MAAAAFSYRSNKNSSDSESDDSDGGCTVWKRASRKTSDAEDLEKIPIEPPVENSAPVPMDNANNLKRKRNNIWCDVLQDQMMSETLNHCGIKNKPAGYGSRGEESYDYTLSHKYQKKDDDADLDDQMSADDVSETSSVHSNKSFKNRKNDNFVHLDSAELAAARKIIKVLCEPKRHLIYRVVKFIGVEKAMELMKMTEDIEENGGMMVNNNQRRRTPGGVYFQLLKADKHIEKSAVDKIFEGEMTSFDRKKFFDEKRKMRKKLKAEKKARLKKFTEDMELSQPTKTQEETQMEEESMPVEEPPVEKNTNGDGYVPHKEVTHTADLEDGEIEDD
ncbi:hypothetical protein AVEN_90787-1 [Araneus ventricosus]|uniref:Phosphorylated adapter RNA export protein n=1 Tax=Araneus ventricosus TaxID=182803 RepID=A0A4Y2G9K7_ARAVE|nr:hypothetical protein AVEN_90787-1 [Araneus ventricosus]